MKENKVITIQDFSSLGQCSLTAALPIISAMGIETVALPIAVLSAQTSCCDDYTYVDLQSNLIPTISQLKNFGLNLDFIYTGYLGKRSVVDDVIKICKDSPSSFIVVDPAMAEHGKLYSGITPDYVDAIIQLCKLSDLALPNVSEACMMAGCDYTDILGEKHIQRICALLCDKGIKRFAITGIKTSSGMKIAYCDRNVVEYFDLSEISGQFYGSGDVFASTVVGGLANGLKIEDALRLAIDFTSEAIKITSKDKSHNYGLKFEKAIPYLVEKTREYCKR